MRSIVLRFVAAAVILAACGDDPPPAPWTAERVCEDLSEIICGGLTTCGCRFDQRPYDATTCKTARTEACVAGIESRLGTDLTSGRLVLDETAINNCLADLAVQVAGCDLAPGDSPLPATCDGVFVAAAGLGEDCPIDGRALCADGAGLCRTTDEGATWKCVARPATGEPCPDEVCAAGLVCKQVVDGAARCDVAGGPDAPCVVDADCVGIGICDASGTCQLPGRDGAPCVDTLDCDEGLICDAERCAAAPALGDPCSAPTACGVGRSCGRAPETRTCEAPNTLGEPCADGTCAIGLGCAQASSTCVTLPGDGAMCLDGARCAPGTTCDFSTTTCVVPPGEGQACLDVADRRCADGLGCREPDLTCQPAASATAGQPCLLNGSEYVCAPGLGCDFTPNGSICATRGGAGTPCNTTRTCDADTYCAGGTQTCAPRVADGEACPGGDECRAGSVCVLGPSGWACAPIPDEGEPCLWDCAPDLACQGPGGVCVAELCAIP